MKDFQIFLILLFPCYIAVAFGLGYFESDKETKSFEDHVVFCFAWFFITGFSYLILKLIGL